jgi:hypothetical protein
MALHWENERLKFAFELAPRLIFWLATIAIFSAPFIAQARAHGLSGRWEDVGQYARMPREISTHISSTAFQERFQEGGGLVKITWLLDGREHPCEQLCSGSYQASLQGNQVVVVCRDHPEWENMIFTLVDGGRGLNVSHGHSNTTYRRASVWHSLFTSAP